MAITRTQIAKQLYSNRRRWRTSYRSFSLKNWWKLQVDERGITQQGTAASGTTSRIDGHKRKILDLQIEQQYSQFSPVGTHNVMAQNLKAKRFQGLINLASRFNPLS